uniref:Chaperone protein DnaJ n=1 Tax=Candidatus Methanophaga sp. ANME-1 ERB7 TaxID=2759913 RepID=A0A7G9ZCV0_9EURY|nr:chaperone protein DnaJ [Methanosarcinales archaeon ANME-1 ERB7]
MVKKIPQSYPWIGSAIGGLIGLIILMTSSFNSNYLILNTVAIGAVIGCTYGWILGIFAEDTNGLIIGGIVGSLFGLHLISLGCFAFGGAYLLIYAKKHERAEDFILDFILFAFVGFILGYLFSILSYLAEDSLITPPPHGGGIAGGLAFAIIGLIPIFNILLGIIFGGDTGHLLGSLIESTSWLNAPLFVVPLFAFVGYGISRVISISEIKKEEWIRKKEDQRLREEEEMHRREEQRRKEQERNEVKNLIDETEIIIETAIHDATKANDSLWLSALKLLQFDFHDFAQEFESSDFSYKADMARLLDLKEQVEVLSTPPPKEEIQEQHKRNYYEILGIKQDATPEQIKVIRDKLSLIYHPDKGRHLGVDGEQRMKEINEAYETLIDPAKRGEYDKKIGI